MNLNTYPRSIMTNSDHLERTLFYTRSGQIRELNYIPSSESWVVRDPELDAYETHMRCPDRKVCSVLDYYAEYHSRIQEVSEVYTSDDGTLHLRDVTARDGWVYELLYDSLHTCWEMYSEQTSTYLVIGSQYVPVEGIGE